MISSGSAIAAIPEVRDAIRSVFGAALGPSVADTPNAGPGGFGLGPLGGMPEMEAVDHRGTAEKGKPDKPGPTADRDKPDKDGADRGEQLGSGSPQGSHDPDRGGSLNGPGDGPNSDGGGNLGQGPDRDARTPPKSGGPAPPGSGGKTLPPTPPPAAVPTPPPPAAVPTPPATEPEQHNGSAGGRR